MMNETNGKAKTKKGVSAGAARSTGQKPSEYLYEPTNTTAPIDPEHYAAGDLTIEATGYIPPQPDATKPSPSDPNLFSLKDDVTLAAIAQAISVARVNRPTIHGERQRRYAIVLTQLEQVYAYCKTFVVQAENV